MTYLFCPTFLQWGRIVFYITHPVLQALGFVACPHNPWGHKTWNSRLPGSTNTLRVKVSLRVLFTNLSSCLDLTFRLWDSLFFHHLTGALKKRILKSFMEQFQLFSSERLFTPSTLQYWLKETEINCMFWNVTKLTCTLPKSGHIHLSLSFSHS